MSHIQFMFIYHTLAPISHPMPRHLEMPLILSTSAHKPFRIVGLLLQLLVKKKNQLLF